MKNSKIFLLFILFVIFLGLIVFVLFKILKNPREENNDSSIDSFEDCVAAGYLIMESYPRRCSIPDGETFTEVIEDTSSQTDEAGLANPASVYCSENGGILEIRDEVGYCMFEDGSSCEEWAFYRGECTNLK